MTPQQKLSEIEKHLEASNLGLIPIKYSEWLISRVKQLEKVINKLCIIQSGEMDYTIDFYELCKVELRSVLKEMPGEEK